MLLEELLFCVVFIVLPLVGMAGVGIKKALSGLNREREMLNGQAIKEEKRLYFKPFFNGVSSEKTLNGDSVHLEPLILHHQIRTHQRAGP